VIGALERVTVAPVAPIVVAVPAPVARIFKVAPGITGRFAVAAETLDSAIEVPFGARDTFVAAAPPVPRLRLGRRGTTQ
jgi:hypothetical protein